MQELGVETIYNKAILKVVVIKTARSAGKVIKKKTAKELNGFINVQEYIAK